MGVEYSKLSGFCVQDQLLVRLAQVHEELFQPLNQCTVAIPGS